MPHCIRKMLAWHNSIYPFASPCTGGRAGKLIQTPFGFQPRQADKHHRRGD